MRCRRIFWRKRNKKNGVGGNRLRPFFKKQIRRKKSQSATAVAAVTRRGEDCGQRTVLVQTEKQSDNDRQATAAKNVRAEETVFRAEDKQSDENPKGAVTLIATSHKKPPVFCRRGYVNSPP